MSTATRIVLICTLSTCGLLCRPAAEAAQSSQARASPRTSAAIPAFKVVGRDSAALSIVVSAGVTEEQLVALVNSFRAARAGGTLAKLIPPTTPNGSRGPYTAVEVFVLTEQEWASSTRLHAFRNPQTSGISDSEKEFGRRIRAYYLFPLTGKEFGSIGYEDQGYQYTVKHRKLF